MVSQFLHRRFHRDQGSVAALPATLLRRARVLRIAGGLVETFASLLWTTVCHAQASVLGNVLIGPGVRGAMKRDSIVATEVVAAGFAVASGSVGLGYVASWKRNYRSLLRHGGTRNCQGENHRAHANREKHRSLSPCLERKAGALGAPALDGRLTSSRAAWARVGPSRADALPPSSRTEAGLAPLVFY